MFGSPRILMRSRIRSRVGTDRRVGMFNSKLMCESSHSRASGRSSKRAVAEDSGVAEVDEVVTVDRVGWDWEVETTEGPAPLPGYEAARRVRALAVGLFNGTRVGWTLSRTTDRSTTHLDTSVRLGRSYITSSRTSSR